MFLRSTSNRPLLSVSIHIRTRHHRPGSTRLHCGSLTCKATRTCQSDRSLERHLRMYHLGASYICWCGASTPRKDKHRDHLKSCQNMVGGEPIYTCICEQGFAGGTTREKNDYRTHFEDCERQERGRKRKDRDA